MRAGIWPTRLPLVLKVPLLVAGLVLLAAALMSSGAVLRLRQEQDARIAGLSSAYLEATSAALAPALARADVWEAFDILDRSRRTFSTLRLRLAVAILPSGAVLASTEPRRVMTGKAPGIELARHLTALLDIDEEAGLAWATRPVVESGAVLGTVLIEIDISERRRERFQLGLVLVAANSALALLLAAAGWWAAHRMLRPVRILTRQLGQGATGPATEVPLSAYAASSPEFRSLFETYNAMARAARQRRTSAAHQAEEERLATLGTLAASLAHEVNNPLGGMLTALDTMSQHGDDPEVRTQSIGFLRRGLEDIRHVVQASLVLYKTPGDVGPLTHSALDDLRYLAGPEAARRRVQLTWENQIGSDVGVDATAVRQAVLNLLLNAVAVSEGGETVRLTATVADARLRIAISDQGGGLPDALVPVLAGCMDMPPAGRTGLGLWTAARAARTMGGSIRREATTRGTTLVLDVPVVPDAAVQKDVSEPTHACV